MTGQFYYLFYAIMTLNRQYKAEHWMVNKFSREPCAMSSTEGSVDLRFAMQTRRRIQGIFQVNDTVVFLLNLALQLANTPNENLDDIDNLSLKYELSVENAVKLSLAAKLLQGIVPEEMLEREDTSAPYAGTSEQTTEGGCTLRVRNLPLTTMEHDIVAVFQSFGTLREVRMQRDKTTGQFFGYVDWVLRSNDQFCIC